MANLTHVDCFCVSGWLGATSTCISLLISPITIGVCRRKSTRLTAVMGGLITSLGCLFTSFAGQFHQMFISYGIMIGKTTQAYNFYYAHKVVMSLLKNL